MSSVQFDVILYKLSTSRSTTFTSSILTMTSLCAYGFFYRFYVLLWFQIATIMESISNTFNFIGLYRRKRAKLPKSLEDKIVMITGANSGIGKETAKVSAMLGARVILACRDQEKAKKAVEEILAEVGKEKEENLFIVNLDLSSLQSVRRCAEQVNNQFQQIDVLINNAGLMMCPQWTTVDGFEMQFAANHLGHFLLTNLLMENIKAAPAGRVVNLSSVAHMPGQMYFNNLNMINCYSPFKSYARSKLANLMFTRELAKRLKGTNVTAYAAHPGLVNTELKRHLNGILQCLLVTFNKMMLISPELGAQTTLYCAFGDETKNQSGFYYE